jgi:putative ABC transport system permease protein
VSWWRGRLRPDRAERQLDAELRDHFDRLVADYVRAGANDADARRRARLEFGGVEQLKEQCRDIRRTRWIDEIVQDLRYGLRLLRQSPAFTFVAVASLALGIGANSAIFTLVDNVLLEPLPVREPDRLVLLDGNSWTNPVWEQIRGRQSEFSSGALAWSDARLDLSHGGATEFVEGVWASGGFFDVLGVPAVLGRTFTVADDRRDGGPDGPVAVISHAFWQRRFGGDAGAIGRTVMLNRVPFTIIGVTPRSFLGPTPGRSFDVAVPLGTVAIVSGGRSWLDDRSASMLEIMARLKPGETAETASAALRGMQPQIREATLPHGWPPRMLEQYLSGQLTLVPAAGGPTALRARYGRPLWILMAVVGLVLLIACANVANLLLARAAGRRHELTLRLALGASRARVTRQLLVESLLLAGVSASVGLLFARWASGLIVQQLSTPRSTVVLDLSFDWRIALFTASIAVATALVFGTAPALVVSRVDPHDALKQQGRTVAAARRSSGTPLLAVQIALTLVLVVAAGLFLRTFVRLATLDIGLDREPVLVVDVDTSRIAATPEARLALFERMREAAAAVPGVAGSGLSLITPVSGAGWNGPVELSGRPDVSPRNRLTFYNSVTPGWFSTYGTALRAGRDFDHRDTPGAPAVAIANEAFVRKYVAGPAVGRAVRYEQGPGGVKQALIIGVVEDAAYRSVRDPIPPILYFPVAQAHHAEGPARLSLSIRSAGEPPARLARAVGDAIARVDGNALLTFRPLSAFIDGALVRERLLAMVSGFFAGLVLLLAGIGLYGLTAYTVSRRKAEIAIRVALGARASGVIVAVMRRIAIALALGLVAGAALSYWAAQYVATLLYGIDARDPLTFVAAAVFLLTVSAVAAWLPARRAALDDPTQVLREV